jgi:hypothetical protein
MTETVKIQPIGEDEAREVINRWSAAGYFRIRNFGDKIFVKEINATTSYNLRLRTHYEERALQRARRPFLGGPVDDRGRPPGMWEVPVRRPREFEERHEVLPLPHTERVQLCPACAGTGRVGCEFCQGSGQTPCPWCQGAGFVERPEIIAGGAGTQGGPTMRTVRKPCSCNGGRVRCQSCAGNGQKTCSVCSGSGKVTTFEQVVVRFLSANKLNVVDDTPVPDDLVGKLSGEVVADEKSPRIDALPSLAPEIDAKGKAMLQLSHELDEDRAHILLQHLHVERVPIHEIRYLYAGVDRQLWICGNEHHVYAPGAPWHRGRLAILVATMAAVLLAAGVAVWFFWLR